MFFFFFFFLNDKVVICNMCPMVCGVENDECEKYGEQVAFCNDASNDQAIILLQK